MSSKIDADFIKKAARLLKCETLDKDKYELYRLHAPVKKKYSRLKINVNSRNEQNYFAELKDLQKYDKQFRYLLVCIDTYSRYAFVKSLKKKTSNKVMQKFESILKKNNEVPEKNSI